MYSTPDKVKLRAQRALGSSSSEDFSRLANVICEAIAWAAAEIDSRLVERYAVPFHPPYPPIVEHICADLAAYYTLRELFAGGGENNAPTLAQEIYEKGMSRLHDLANGTSRIPGLPDLTSTRGSLISRDRRPGIMAGFDGVNRPPGDRPPFAPYRRY